MSGIPVALSGAVTVALIIILGVFIYPSLLKHRSGKGVIAIVTVLLAMLAFLFDRASGLSSHPVASAVAIALAPLLTGTIVHQLQRAGRT